MPDGQADSLQLCAELPEFMPISYFTGFPNFFHRQESAGLNFC
jgi:hypothetical protein